MIMPFFNLVTHRPDLLIDHVAGYLKLAQDEVSGAKKQLIRRTLSGAIALVLAVSFIVLAGMAIMLASMSNIPTAPEHAISSTLVLVTGVVLVAAIVAAIFAMKSGVAAPDASFADHIQRDIQAFREVIQADGEEQ